MGLRQGDSSHHKHPILASWVLPLTAISLAVILASLGDNGRAWFSFLRPAIADGEFWRLLSGHFVHLGVSHLLMNIAGLVLVWYLIAASFRLGEWLVIVFAVIIGMDIGLWYLQPNLRSYVGLSGLLHGLLAAGIVGSVYSKRVDLWVLGAALIGKLAYEQLVGPLPGSEETAGGTVIVAAHAYGAVAGAIVAGLLMIRVRPHASI